MKKHLLLLFLILLPMVARADAVEIDGIYYNLVKKVKEAEVIRNPYGYEGDIIIPETITYEEAEYIVKYIGISAFENCENLTTVNISNNVVSIKEFAFSGCSRLKSISVGNGLSYIGECAFQNCQALVAVHITDLVSWCQISCDGYMGNPLHFAHHLYLNDVEVKDLIIPNSLKRIGNYVFEGCTGLRSVLFSDYVENTGIGAFSNCKGMTKISFGKNIKEINAASFYGCSSLISVEIPTNITSIGKNAFENCTNLKSITIPNGVTTINGSFPGCASLTSVTIPSTVNNMGGAFSGCSSLTSVTIQNGITTIGGGAFMNCSKLKQIEIPNSVTKIESNAFSECSDLTYVSIGAGIQNISYYAFAGCGELLDIYCHASNVPFTLDNAFHNSFIEHTTLHVPASSINDYKNAEPWKNFKEVVALEETTPKVPKCAIPIIIYKNGKLSFECETEGVEYITEIADEDVGKFYDSSISLTATYNICVFATKNGYDNSDVVTATLCWIDQQPMTEGISNGVTNVSARAVLIQTQNGNINLQGGEEGSNVTVYDISGAKLASGILRHGEANISTNLQSGSVALVKVGDKAVKVVMK